MNDVESIVIIELIDVLHFKLIFNIFRSSQFFAIPKNVA